MFNNAFILLKKKVFLHTFFFYFSAQKMERYTLHFYYFAISSPFSKSIVITSFSLNSFVSNNFATKVSTFD